MSRTGPTISAPISAPMSRRVLVAITALSASGGAAAALVGAVSLTRIAAENLGFPPLLTWTLTAAVDIGAVAGAVMWSTSSPKTSIRRTGMRLNISCSLISAFGVGLDHAVHASSSQAWRITAFIIGAFLPLLSTWLVHALAKVVAASVRSGTPSVSTETVPAEIEVDPDTDDEPEFVEPVPVIPAPRIPTPLSVAASPESQVDDQMVREIDEIEIEQAMREHNVGRDIAEIMVRDRVSRATAYRRRGAGNAALA